MKSVIERLEAGKRFNVVMQTFDSLEFRRTDKAVQTLLKRSYRINRLYVFCNMHGRRCMKSVNEWLEPGKRSNVVL